MRCVGITGANKCALKNYRGKKNRFAEWIVILTKVSFQWHRSESNSVWRVGTLWTLTRPDFPPTALSTSFLPTLLHLLPSLVTSTRPPGPLVLCTLQRMSHLASCPGWWKRPEAGEKEQDEGSSWHLGDRRRPQDLWLGEKGRQAQPWQSN